MAELAAAEERSKLNNFLKTEKNIVSAPVKAFKSGVFFICVMSILGFKTNMSGPQKANVSGQFRIVCK